MTPIPATASGAVSCNESIAVIGGPSSTDQVGPVVDVVKEYRNRVSKLRHGLSSRIGGLLSKSETTPPDDADIVMPIGRSKEYVLRVSGNRTGLFVEASDLDTMRVYFDRAIQQADLAREAKEPVGVAWASFTFSPGWDDVALFSDPFVDDETIDFETAVAAMRGARTADEPEWPSGTGPFGF